MKKEREVQTEPVLHGDKPQVTRCQYLITYTIGISFVKTIYISKLNYHLEWRKSSTIQSERYRRICWIFGLRLHISTKRKDNPFSGVRMKYPGLKMDLILPSVGLGSSCKFSLETDAEQKSTVLNLKGTGTRLKISLI